MKWAGSGCCAPGTQRNRPSQTDGSSVWRWYLLSCCLPLILEKEGAHRTWCWLQLAALCILVIPSQHGESQRCYCRKDPQCHSNPPVLRVDGNGGCLDPSVGASRGFLQLGPAWCSVLGVSHPSQSLVSSTALAPVASEKPCHCPAPELPHQAHFKGWWGAELQLRSHVTCETSSVPSTSSSSPLGRGVLQEAIGPAQHPLLLLMYVTGAGVARRQHPPPRALHSQRGSALVT